jgi:predicted RNase H-like HicB family nuclease
LVEEVKPKSKYALSLARDERGWWVATLPEVPGCHSQGRTIEQARERIREALQAWFDLAGPYSGKLVDSVELAKPLLRAISSAEEARERARSAEELASERTRDAIVAMVETGLSLRDAGELLGVTRQRAQQLAASVAKTRTAVRKTRGPKPGRERAARSG